MKYIDAFPKKSEQFWKDFTDIFIPDVVEAAVRRNISLTPTQIESLLSLCIDKINVLIFKCKNEKIAFHCIRVELEFLPSDCVKFSFKAIDSESNLLRALEPGEELYFMATADDIRKFEKRFRPEITFIPEKKPNSN